MPDRAVLFVDGSRGGCHLDLGSLPAPVANLSITQALPLNYSPSDFNGLKKLAQASGHRFAFGVLLYDGDTVTSLGVISPLAALIGHARDKHVDGVAGVEVVLLIVVSDHCKS